MDVSREDTSHNLEVSAPEMSLAAKVITPPATRHSGNGRGIATLSDMVQDPPRAVANHKASSVITPQSKMPTGKGTGTATPLGMVQVPPRATATHEASSVRAHDKMLPYTHQQILKQKGRSAK